MNKIHSLVIYFFLLSFPLLDRVVMMKKKKKMSHEQRKSRTGVRRHFCGRPVIKITITILKRHVHRFALMAKSTMAKKMVLKNMLTYF